MLRLARSGSFQCGIRRAALLEIARSWGPASRAVFARGSAVPFRRLSVSSSFVPLLVLGMAAYTATPAGASGGFQRILPQELSMTSEPQAPGARAIILDRRVDRYDAGHTPHEDNYFRIKILTEEGRKYADIEIPFVKRREDVVNIKARTIRPDGSIVNFDGKIFEKTIVKAKGLKYLAKTFTLPEVQAGSIIEYYYTIDFSENYVFESHWILSGELFTKKASFSLKPYYSDYSNINVRWSWHALPAGTLEPKEGPDHIVRLEAANIPAFQTEDFFPPENETNTHIDFLSVHDAFPL